MSQETQAILAGHLTADEVAQLVVAAGKTAVSVRGMQRPEYKIVEFRQADGAWSALNLFLDSWAADDYAHVFTGPGTLATAECSPDNLGLLRSLVSATGGMLRIDESQPWMQISAAES
ncbi:hypothetical protein FJQ54_05235 [Sandaracinobacter neustonicus]|uniref:Uncharacterized protein n=1 Tax=Sandaracinobacter neustonicus TaxID=1715348 RepID=A0A501XQT6_9SPHN|nr:hypothetical protein [Sandaracinobacter neustonicus]TPE62594.1 hypothetical protein FJQ54_05235 [Sandaracinobacter neustonicus]